MSSLDPITRSRDLARVAEEASDWQERLRHDPQSFDDPFQMHRARLGKSALDELREELPETDPLRAPLMAWTYALSEQRINHWWLTHTHQLRYAEKVALPVPVKGTYTRHELLLKTLPPREEQAHYWAGFQTQALRLSEAECTLWQRRKEVSERFGLTSPDALLRPCPDPNALALHCLERARSGLEELRSSTPYAWQNQGLAAAAAPTLPAHLNPPTLAHWLREGRLLHDLPLRSWTLPNWLVPASFLRALDELGQEFRRACAPTQQPFVIAHDPGGLENHALGYCFASLLTNPVFLERNLDLARKNQRDFRRSMALSLYMELCTRALKTQLHAAAYTGTSAAREAFQSSLAEHFGVQVPAGLTLVWLRLRVNDAQRFLGAARGLSWLRQLREAHDEDWFRNPRAVEQILAEMRWSPVCHITQEQALAAVDDALEELQAAL